MKKLTRYNSFSKKGLQFSFAWLFAIMVGAVIIFLAVYGAMQFSETSKYRLDTAMAKRLDIIFEPMKTSIESGKSDVAVLPEEAKIYNECNSGGAFGQQTFYLSTRLGVADWERRGGGITVNNKYIFSNSTIKGKNIYILSKPFRLGYPSQFYSQQIWKVGSLISLSTNRYCFKNPPYEIKNDIRNLKNIEIDNCSAPSTTVCFGSGSCDIMVRGRSSKRDYRYGVVSKNDEEFPYIGNLLYPAIFSNKNIYECNVRRLMKRAIQQALIYEEQGQFLAGKDKCGATAFKNLKQIVGVASQINNSRQLINGGLREVADQVRKDNAEAQCRLW